MANYIDEFDRIVTTTKRNQVFYGRTESKKLASSFTEVASDVVSLYEGLSKIKDGVDVLASGFLMASGIYSLPSGVYINMYDNQLYINDYQSIIDEQRYIDGEKTSYFGVSNAVVGYWPLDDGVGTRAIDKSATKASGILNDGTLWYEDSTRGSCINLDGTDDYIRIGDSPYFTFGDGASTDSQFSVSAWINMDDATHFPVLCKYDRSNTDYEWVFKVNEDDKLYMVLYDNASSVYIGRYYNTAITSYEGSWTHVVGTYNASKSVGGIKLYINGSKVDDTSTSLGSYGAMHDTDARLFMGYLDTALVARYKMEDNAANTTVTDDTGNHNGVASTNTSNMSTTGKYGLGFDFDRANTEFITIDDSPDFSFGDGTTDSPFSVCAWINMDDATSFLIMSRYASTAGQFEWTFYCAVNDKLYLSLFDNNSTIYIYRGVNAVMTGYQGAWTHVVATYDGSSSNTGIKIYINNSLAASTGGSNGAYAAMHNLVQSTWIGKWPTPTYADGKMDDVRLYNKELSVSEIDEIYNNTSPSYYADGKISDVRVYNYELTQTNVSTLYSVG